MGMRRFAWLALFLATVAAMAYATKDKSLKKWAAVGVQNSGSDLTVKQTAIVVLFVICPDGNEGPDRLRSV